MENLTNYTSRIHTLPKGWSSKSKLKIAHQYWLDPEREDEGYQAARIDRSYQQEVINDFSSWINKELQLREKGLNLGTEYRREWVKMAQESFRRYNETIFI